MRRRRFTNEHRQALYDRCRANHPHYFRVANWVTNAYSKGYLEPRTPTADRLADISRMGRWR